MVSLIYLIELDKLEVIYPSSEYASKGILVKAYIHFLEKITRKQEFSWNVKSYYPGSKDIVYVNYLDAMTYYVLIKNPILVKKIPIKLR